MADFSTIIQEINEEITTNGVGAITGAILNTTLNDIVDAVNAAKADVLPDYSVYGGTADKNLPPTYGNDHRYYYLAFEAGTYQYFDNIVLDGSHITMLYWDGSHWDQQYISLTTNGEVELLQPLLRKDGLYFHLGFPFFEPSDNYVVGDLVVYNGNLYRFNSNHSGAWTGNDVDQTDLFEVLNVTFTNLANGKADKVSGATAGNFAGLDADGNLTDSGSKASDFATAAQGAKADTAYQKPASGIPSSDMSSAVQTSLGKADSALQSFTESDPVFSASPAAGITSGNISSWNGKEEPIEIVDASTPPMTMQPDKVYQYGTLSGDTTFPLLLFINDGKAHIHCWTFTTPATAPTITWPVAITDWAGGSAPTINASKKYEVSVMDGVATIIEA